MLVLRSAGMRPIEHDFYGDNCNKPFPAAATAGACTRDFAGEQILALQFSCRGYVPNSLKRKAIRLSPKILIFDVDGVLVDVRGSFWGSALDTMRFLTGKHVTWADLYKWKAMPGNNDDWNMVSRWATALGRPTTYKEARAAFQPFYWGENGNPGNVRKEKLMVTPAQIARWARCFELNLFTGRTRQEFAYTFDRWPATRSFRMVVTMDDVKRKKPHPDGLLKILGQRDPATALYVGDNIDDALAAREAQVPFIAILAPGAHASRARAKKFRELGALALLPRAAELNRWLQLA